MRKIISVAVAAVQTAIAEQVVQQQATRTQSVTAASAAAGAPRLPNEVGRHGMRGRVTLLVASIVSLSCSGAFAAYTRYQSSAVTIQSIYANELGSPFLVVTPTVNATCGGLYLYDTMSGSPDLELRRNKMAVALAAIASGKQVTLDFYSDPGVPGWASCYIQGIQIVN
jgi:hypothetical protein